MPGKFPPEARILTSAAFRRARLRAASTSASAPAMRRLLDEVAQRQEPRHALTQGPGRLHLDVICSVVEAHLEALEECARAHPAPRAQRSPETGPTSITAKARLRLALAALHYVVDPDDATPGARPRGERDDLLVLRWAARMAWRELPAV